MLETVRLPDWPGSLRNEADAGLKAVRESGRTVDRTRFSLRLRPESETPRLAPRFLQNEAHAGFKPVRPAGGTRRQREGRVVLERGGQTGRLRDSQLCAERSTVTKRLSLRSCPVWHVQACNECVEGRPDSQTGLVVYGRRSTDRIQGSSGGGGQEQGRGAGEGLAT